MAASVSESPTAAAGNAVAWLAYGVAFQLVTAGVQLIFLKPLIVLIFGTNALAKRFNQSGLF